MSDVRGQAPERRQFQLTGTFRTQPHVFGEKTRTSRSLLSVGTQRARNVRPLASTRKGSEFADSPDRHRQISLQLCGIFRKGAHRPPSRKPSIDSARGLYGADDTPWLTTNNAVLHSSITR